MTLKRLMKRRDIELRRFGILRTNPISAVISPRFLNHERLTMKLEFYSIVIEPISLNVTYAFHEAKYFVQRSEGKAGRS